MKALKLMKVAVAAMLYMALSTQHVWAVEGVISVESANTFEQTVGKLKKATAANKLVILKAFDHQKMVKMVGANADKSMSFEIFHPRFGKQIDAKDRSAFMVAPLRVMIQMDGDKVMLRYQQASVLLKPYNGLDELGKKLDTLIAQVVETAAK